MSTSISEIVEITNTSPDTYFMYVHDEDNEGRYTPYGKDDWHYPANGEWYKLTPGSHFRADDCGIPDGGKSAGISRSRVIFRAESPGQAVSQGDPDRGLRVNRVSVGDGQHDALLFRDNATGLELKRVQIPNVMHQSLSLIIDDKGAGFHVVDSTASTESQVQEAFRVMGVVFETCGELFLETMKHIPEA